MKLIYVLLSVVLLGCSQQPVETEWTYEKSISLDGINPIGLVSDDDQYILSDGDHNRVVKVDHTGEITQTIGEFERPMHLDYVKDKSTQRLFIPEYGKDSIAVIEGTNKSYLSITDSLDAPASISMFKDEIAIADFYNHRVLYFSNGTWQSLGSEGKKLGQFYYPTDVQIMENHLYIADAYNDRAQVWTKNGEPVMEIGMNDNLKAATGIHVTATELFLTDFENDRILIYDRMGDLKQIIEKGIDKPTDVIQNDDELIIANYRKGELVFYKKTAIKRKQ
ncbi:NHL repeat-containing protein [Nonlabens tegetincola]|uniref:NHL repeat-containing protein n=1 Tax=Nonlabens TaxID=363408 RepID=UPI0030C7CEB5